MSSYPRFELDYDKSRARHVQNGNFITLKAKNAADLHYSITLKESASRREYYPYPYYHTQHEYATPIEVWKKIFVVNEYRFVVVKNAYESCGSEGRQTKYYISAELDTTFDSFARLILHCNSITFAAEDGQYHENLMMQTIGLAAGIRYVPENYPYFPSDRNKFYLQETRVLKSYSKSLRKQLSGLDTNILALPEFKVEHSNSNYLWNLYASGKKRVLIDTITGHRVTLALEYIDSLSNLHSRYNCTIKNEARIYKNIAERRYPISIYLNHLNDYTDHWSALDTLDKISICNYLRSSALKYDYFTLDYPDNRYYSNRKPFNGQVNFDVTIAKRFTLDFEEHFVKTFYANHLHHANPNHYPYVHVVDTDSMDNYFFFNQQQGKTSKIILASFRAGDNGNWSFTLDTLEEKIHYKGSDRLLPFNDLFLLYQRDAVYIIDTTISPARSFELKQWPDTLNDFLFHAKDIEFNSGYQFVIPHSLNFQRDRDAVVTKKVWDTLVANKQFNMLTTVHPNDHIDLDHGDTIITKQNYYSTIRQVLRPEQMIYNVSYRISDLNGDRINELYTYSVSNGKVITISCMTSGKDGIQEIEDETAINWLSNQNDFRNVLLYSRIGNLTDTE